MTELEMIERAKMYMDKLANGVNPLDGTIIPDDDVVNQVRLSRCFFFVSDVLRRVIENGGVEPKSKLPKPLKVPFSLPYENRSSFPYSETPITASDIAKRINALRPCEDMYKMNYSHIAKWLCSIGILQMQELPDGKNKKIPTSVGKEVGLFLEDRIGKDGPYQVVLYNRHAQEYVLDNLDAIIATMPNK